MVPCTIVPSGLAGIWPEQKTKPLEMMADADNGQWNSQTVRQ